MGGGNAQRIVNLGGGRGHLREDAAKSLHRVDKRLGHRSQITEALRSWLQQDEHYQSYLSYLRGGPWAPIALSPNTPSVHQKGAAVDSDELQQRVALMEEHGWFRTVYRMVGGKWTLVEAWHFEYDPSRDRHYHEIVTLVQTASGAWHLPDPAPIAPKPESRDIEMRMIWNRDDSDEQTKRALVGEFTFQRLSPLASKRERKLFGEPVDVDNTEFDGFLATVNSRRATAGLKPISNPRTGK
ncbi:hypothetical protein J7E68_06555 [Microbacterium sp. ISL-103]|uniref:hypothetical protein n=1 Tax=Microbacterium sp. ISL-103 TaxID=2819156 RepID=UPI001BEA2D43|nr:hypothetical protein [Microbacterium sp. ISL-103]MBT2474247.1 hypothetical protein [Microbacterium sp. ISL-103]